MKNMLEGKVIAIAGGAGGIGSGLSRRYAEEGAKVVIGDLDGGAAAKLATEIDPSGKRVISTPLDGADDGSVAAFMRLVKSTFGKLDGMHVNFVDATDRKMNYDVLNIPLDLFEQMMHTNPRGYFLCSRHAIPLMIENGGGSIIYTSSIDATRPTASGPAYGMGKAALHALMRHVAVRFGGQNIRANCITPGIIWHERMGQGDMRDYIYRLRDEGLLKVFGKPSDIAALGALLLSDDGAYITGQVISVDGGLSPRQ
jgi:NAD(P)-dependent dehydrogenase (short-subunit alcohol dehydrogenase family)